VNRLLVSYKLIDLLGISLSFTKHHKWDEIGRARCKKCVFEINFWNQQPLNLCDGNDAKMHGARIRGIRPSIAVSGKYKSDNITNLKFIYLRCFLAFATLLCCSSSHNLCTQPNLVRKLVRRVLYQWINSTIAGFSSIMEFENCWTYLKPYKWHIESTWSPASLPSGRCWSACSKQAPEEPTAPVDSYKHVLVLCNWLVERE